VDDERLTSFEATAMNKFALLSVALSFLYASHPCASRKATAQTTAAQHENADVVPIRVEVKPLGSTKPGIIRFSVDLINLQPERTVHIKAVDLRRPFRFRIIDNATGRLVNPEDFPRLISEEEVKTGDLTLVPGKPVSFEVIYPRDETRVAEGSYEVQAMMGIKEFRVGDQQTKLTDFKLLYSNEVDFQVNKTLPTTVIPPTTENPG
jgi:hypothetical protein